ncbi:MAG: helix-hairpin-helix domain-containing protein [Bacteroidales bacterium]
MSKRLLYKDNDIKLTRHERRALFALSTIIVLLLIANIFYKQVFHDKYKADKETKAEISAYLDSVKMLEEEKNKPIFFAFNPNTSPADSIMQLSISKRVKSNIISYRKGGGEFRKKEDLKRIYGMTDSLYELLEAWVIIGKIEKKSVKEKEKKSEYIVSNDEKEQQKNINSNDYLEEPKNTITAKRSPSKLNLNTADTAKLKALPGIGSSYARRIVKYRELLGGFHSIEQLKEVYGMKDEYYEQFAPYCIANIAEIRKININFADYRELIRHPYIDKEMTKALLNFRNKNGSFSSVDKLLDIEVFDRAKFDKVKYYFKTE